MSHSKYVYKRDLSEQEEQVRMWGFPYVNKIELDPTTCAQQQDTHLIVQGELTIWKIKESRKFGPYKVGDCLPVAANTCYRAVAGAEGCIFIEGHKDLSPTSADRFERKGTITETPVGDMTDNGKDEILCTHGRCHLSNGRWYHMCAEFGKGPSTNEACNVKEQMQGGKPSR